MSSQDFSDAQLMRAITLGLAVVWTATSDHISLRQTIDTAQKMARYIETGEKPSNG